MVGYSEGEWLPRLLMLAVSVSFKAMWTLTTTLKIFLQNPSWCITVKVRYLCIWSLKLKLIGPGNFSWFDYKTCIVHQNPCQETQVFFGLFCPCYTTSLWHPMGELLNLMSFCFDPSIPRATRILFLPYRQSKFPFYPYNNHDLPLPS